MINTMKKSSKEGKNLKLEILKTPTHKKTKMIE